SPSRPVLPVSSMPPSAHLKLVRTGGRNRRRRRRDSSEHRIVQHLTVIHVSLVETSYERFHISGRTEARGPSPGISRNKRAGLTGINSLVRRNAIGSLVHPIGNPF